jgi:hypothetical protein
VRRDESVHLLLPVLVIGGLAASVVLVLLTGELPADLPGVALGSDLILAVERVVALFAAWMAIVIVVVRSLAGDLPNEISGHGFRYADREHTARAVSDMRRTVRAVEADVEALREEIVSLHQR